MCIRDRAQDAKTLRIGFQKYGTLTIVRALGDLDKRLAAQGITVKWTEFPAGPQLLEGLNVGSIDFGTVGEAPPVFAQAAGAALVYVGNEPPSPTSEAVSYTHLDVYKRQEQIGVLESVCIVDDGGYPIALERMDGARITGPQIAWNKAFTAAGHKRSTHLFTCLLYTSRCV